MSLKVIIPWWQRCNGAHMASHNNSFAKHHYTLKWVQRFLTDTKSWWWEKKHKSKQWRPEGPSVPGTDVWIHWSTGKSTHFTSSPNQNPSQPLQWCVFSPCLPEEYLLWTTTDSFCEWREGTSGIIWRVSVCYVFYLLIPEQELLKWQVQWAPQSSNSVGNTEGTQQITADIHLVCQTLKLNETES